MTVNEYPDHHDRHRRIQVQISFPGRQYQALRAEIDTAIRTVLSSGISLNGPATRRFADEFASWCGVARCVPVANGTDALELSLRALGVQPRDEVITVANAGGYTATACRLVGATPVWIDVRDDTLGLDPTALRAGISAMTKVVVVTHLYGLAVDVAAVQAVLDDAGRTDIAILEDCAQAHGATVGGRRVGSLGDIAIFSFYPTKNLSAAGDAGAVVTNRGELADAVSKLHQYGWSRKYTSEMPNGRNSRMDEIQAAILSIKLPHVDGWNARRRSIIDRYAAVFKQPTRVVGHGDRSNAGHLAVVRTRHRAPLRQALKRAGIGTDIHYPVLDCDQPSHKGLPGRRLPLPVSEGAQDEILTLPCDPYLTEAEVDRVIAATNDAMVSDDG